MTAYDMFKREYYHNMGHVMRRIWVANKGFNSPKAFIMQSFVGALDEYTVEYASCKYIFLEYGPDETDGSLCDKLQSIEVSAGYWLCFYDGHTGDWRFSWYESKAEAKLGYKELYTRYFRHQDWFHTMLVR